MVTCAPISKSRCVAGARGLALLGHTDHVKYGPYDRDNAGERRKTDLAFRVEHTLLNPGCLDAGLRNINRQHDAASAYGILDVLRIPRGPRQARDAPLDDYARGAQRRDTEASTNGSLMRLTMNSSILILFEASFKPPSASYETDT